MDVKEFAKRAEISKSLAYELIAAGSVPGVRRVGRPGRRGTIRISEEGLATFLRNSELPVRPKPSVMAALRAGRRLAKA